MNRPSIWCPIVAILSVIAQPPMRWDVVGTRRLPDELERAVWNADAVALGRVIKIRRIASPSTAANAEFRFVIEELWAGRGSTDKSILVRGGQFVSNGRITLPAFSTPIARNDLVIAFLRRARAETYFDLTECALLAQREKLVFAPGLFGRGVPVETCKQSVRDAQDEKRDPSHGRILGMVIRADRGLPVAHAIVEDLASQMVDTSDASGWFDLKKVPIGDRSIQVRAPGIPAQQAIIPVTHETIDTLLIQLHPQ
jgi:hypothetical protein